MKFWKRCVNRLWVNKFPSKILDFGWHHALEADVTGFKLHMHVVLKLCQLFLSMCFNELKVNYTACLIKKTKSFYFIEANSLCRLRKETSNMFSVFSFYRKRNVSIADVVSSSVTKTSNTILFQSTCLWRTNRYMCWISILKLANRFLCSTDDKAKEIWQNMSQVETKTTDIVSRLRCITSPAMKNKLKLIRLKLVLIFA